MSHSPLELSLDAVRHIADRFALSGNLLSAGRHGSGHINDTLIASFERGGGEDCYVFQRINHHVFKNVPQLMENISRVTSHVAGKAARNGEHRSLQLIPTRDGATYSRTPDGDFWRVYEFMEGARTYDAPESPRQAFEAARAFGRFQQWLADLPGDRLHETIPHFHDTPRRVETLRRAAATDSVGRKKQAATELEFAFAREHHAGRLLDLARAGDIPERVTHNDTKLNNVMLDDKTGEAVCVIDLDTVMPGLSLWDFGDLVRFGANTAAEDEPDASKIDVALSVFEALVQGYVAGVGDILTEAEWDHLVFSSRLITYEIGVRFLTDYLEGDIYFKTAYPEHNLVRARSQFRLVDRMEATSDDMEEIVRKQRPRRVYANGHSKRPDC